MENDMDSLFAEGGLNTGDAQVDPISGNEVPPGSMPEEVRDDVDAKLSGGEYVVPADVLRYYGVSFFEKLRKKAKEGLSEMDADGRIGGGKGEPAEMEEDDDLPFNEEDLMFEDEGEEMEMAEGGVVPPGGLKTFDPAQFYPGFSAFGGAAPLTTATQGNTESKIYVNAQGQQMTIQFINGQPQQAIPAGFYPQGQAPAATSTTPAPVKAESPNRDERRGEQGLRTGTAGKGPEWASGKDWSNMSAEDATKLATERLGGNGLMKGLGQAAGLLGPVAGIVGGAAANLRPYAEANALEKVLRAKGNTAAADAVASLVDNRLADAKIGIRTLEPMLANGTGIAKNILAGTQTTTAPAATTRPASAPTKTGDSAAGKTFVKDGDRSGGAGTPKGPISGPTGGNSQKKGTPAPAPAKATPAKTSSNPAPSKSQGGGKPRGGRATGGLIERRKK